MYAGIILENIISEVFCLVYIQYVYLYRLLISRVRFTRMHLKEIFVRPNSPCGSITCTLLLVPFDNVFERYLQLLCVDTADI